MSKKRKLNALEDDSNSSKRHRMDSHNIVSSLFTGLGQNQFVELFKIIEQSELIKKLNIWQDINKQIAEYSVGKWGICENEKMHRMHCRKVGRIIFEEDYEPFCGESISIY